MNLSLGGYGSPNSLYDVAENLANSGTISVIAAGNSEILLYRWLSFNSSRSVVRSSIADVGSQLESLASEVFYGEDGETDLVEISEGGINAPIAGNRER